MTRTEYVFGRLTVIYGDEFSRKFRPVGQTTAQIEAHVQAMTAEWDRALRGFGSDVIAGVLDAIADGRAYEGKCPNLPQLVRLLREYNPAGVAQRLLLGGEGGALTPEKMADNRRRIRELLAGLSATESGPLTGLIAPHAFDQMSADGVVAEK